MQKQDLSKIDFGKLTLPEWQGGVFYVNTIGNQVHIRNDKRGSVAVWLKEKGWSATEYATGTFAELDQLRAICSQVDQFIATELARLAEPDWVEVKWTEVNRLEKSGARLQWKAKCDRGWIDGTELMGCAFNDYQVDRKTIPDGVALYEPEWVEIQPCHLSFLDHSKAHTQFRERENGTWTDRLWGGLIPYPCQLQGDRKTFPPGFELTKAKAVVDVRNPIRATPSFGRDMFGRETLQTTTAEQIDSHRESILARHRDSVINSDSPQWLPCTREEAKAHLAESETLYGTKGKWWNCGEQSAMAYSGNHTGPGTPKEKRAEYRTRAKVDRWVKVPWGDIERLSRLWATVEASDTGPAGPWWGCSHPCGVDVTKTSYRADRSTLPSGYVLGVGFVEEVPVKVEDTKPMKLRDKLDTKLIERHGMRVATPSEMVCALVSVLDEERASK